MYPRSAIPASLAGLAARQAHVVSRAQVLSAGLGDHAIERFVGEGRWQPMALGVYAVGDDDLWLQRAWAGLLIGGRGAVLGQTAAAYLHGLPVPRDPQVAVFVGDHHVRRDPRWRFIRTERAGTGTPPRTDLPQTIVDCCRVLGPTDAEALVLTAVAGHGVRPSDVRHVLDVTPRHPRRDRLLRLLEEAEAGVESVLESRYLRNVERAHRLPVARRQVRLGRWRSDVLYEDFNVIVELDGRQFHSGARAFADMDRDNVHQLQGLLTLRFGWSHVTTTPCAVAAQVAVALRLGGWRGSRRTCRRCAQGGRSSRVTRGDLPP